MQMINNAQLDDVSGGFQSENSTPLFSNYLPKIVLYCSALPLNPQSISVEDPEA